jgi:hypothetical protein
MTHIIISGISFLIILFFIYLAKHEFPKENVKLSKINWGFLIIFYTTIVEFVYFVFFVMPYFKMSLIFIKNLLW